MRNLKEAFNNVSMPNGDEQIRNNPQTDPFLNDEPMKEKIYGKSISINVWSAVI